MLIETKTGMINTEDISVLNNAGVDLLIKGQLEDAHVMFTKAIVVSKLLIEKLSEAEQSGAYVSPLESQLELFQPVAVSDQLNTNFQKGRDSPVLNQGAFVYLRAFLLPVDQYLCIETISLTVLFNTVSLLQ